MLCCFSSSRLKTIILRGPKSRSMISTNFVPNEPVPAGDQYYLVIPIHCGLSMRTGDGSLQIADCISVRLRNAVADPCG